MVVVKVVVEKVLLALVPAIVVVDDIKFDCRSCSV
jgi:hypothetical protein